MTTEKAYSASVPLEGKLFVTGGYKNKFAKLNTTEFVSFNGTVTTGPPLPSARYKHCMVVLESGKVMLIGGHVESGSLDDNRSVMTFDPDSNKFNESIPPLIYPALRAGCAVFKSAEHGNRSVVLSVGGTSHTGSKPNGNAEVYDYTQPNARWTKSKCYNYLSL